jgi:transposase
MTHCAGIDVSKDHLDLALHEDSEVERLPNSLRGAKAIAQRLRTSEVQRVVVESTGGYERRLVAALEKAGIPVALVNPWRVRRFGEGLGLLAKTDSIDARLLARFARQAEPAETPAKSRESRRLGSFIRRRRQLVAMVVAEKARLENADRWLQSSIQDLVRILERRVEKIDALIDQAVERDPILAGKRDLIPSVDV